MPETPPMPSRRSLLRGAAATAAAVTAASAGCLELLPPLGQRVRYGRVDAPAPREPRHRNWLPAERVLQDRPFDLRPNVAATPSRSGSELLGEPVPIGSSFVSSNVDHFGIGIEHYDRVVWLTDAVVMEGPVDPDAVGRRALETGYREAGQYEDYQLYDRDDWSRTVGVADGRIAFGSGEHASERVAALVDARAGRVERRHEADPYFEEVTDRIGGRPFLMHAPTGISGLGDRVTESAMAGFDVDEDAVYFLNYLRYEDGAEPTPSQLRSELDDEIFTDQSSDVEVSVEGSTGVVVSRIPHEAFLQDRDPAATPPQVTWSVDAERDRVVVSHRGGDAVRTDRLEVTSLGGETITVPLIEDRRLLGAGSTFELDRSDLEDDSGVTGRADGFRLLWSDPDGASASLLRYELA